MKSEHKEWIMQEVVKRVLNDKVVKTSKMPLETIIHDTIYHEKKRLDQEKRSKRTLQESQYWKKLHKKMLSGNEEEKKNLIQEIISRFAHEIVGNFNPKVYSFSTKILPIGLSILLNTISPGVLFSHFPKLPDVSDRLIIQGEIELIQTLQNLGTIILVPNHNSNMDSIAMGLAIHKIQLPPFIYGAGLNLFSNSVISYFMNNLGAYKVDRKKTASLYKDTLKEYATCTLECGYHNLFFPGGTRSRSGEIEDHLKLGLLGTGIKAYITNLQKGKEKPNIFVVPCTISYQLVLEAEHLIEDYLKSTGKSRYIIEDDEFSKLRRILNFLTSILQLDSRICVRFCPAMDLFGNRVDKQGISYDKRGRIVDISRYTWVDGKVDHEPQRDMQYTKELAEQIKKSYYKNNVIMSTHLVAFVVFHLLKRHHPEMDLYRLLRTVKEDDLPLREVYESMEKVLARIKKMVANGDICLDEHIKNLSVDAICDEALKHFRIYHSKVALLRQGDHLYPQDPDLLFYYSNRLKNYELEKGMEG